MTVRDKILALIQASDLELDGELKDDTSLIHSGLLDSSALFNLAVLIEREAGTPIDPSSFDLATEWDTIADIVEMFTDIDRSPPVPTMSRNRPGIEIGAACSNMASTRPVTSGIVSPLVRSATAKPAIWAEVAWPERISPIAQAAWSWRRSWRATSVPRTSGQREVMRGPGGGS